jgi:ATP-dependent DNA helicase RecG
VKQALSNHPLPPEHYPAHFMAEYELLPYKDALHNIHFPKNKDMLIKARRRMVFDEFFDFLYYLRQNKDQSDQLSNEYQMIETADTVRFLEQLPFSLTKAQKKVWAEMSLCG